VTLPEAEVNQFAGFRFTIATQGTRPLHIHKIQTNCTCSGLEREMDGRTVGIQTLTLAPSEKAAVVLRVKVVGRMGQWSQSRIVLHSNDPEQRAFPITLVVEKVTGGLLATPQDVVFDDIPEGTTAEQTVHLQDYKQPRGVIKTVESSRPGFITARWQPIDPARTATGNEGLGDVVVTCAGDRPGRFNEIVRVFFTDPARPPETIKVIGQVVPAVKLTPATVVLPRKVGGVWVYHATCLCRSLQGRAFDLAAPNVPDGLAVTITPAEDDPMARVVRVEVRPPMQAVLPPESPSRWTVTLEAQTAGRKIPLTLTVLQTRKVANDGTEASP
jgi:hypothetical protein